MDRKLVHNRILVTGGAGFIGSHLVDRLVEMGADVLVLDKLSTGLRSNVNRRARFYHGDVTDREAVRNCLADVELIYHLAADATTRESSMGWDTPSTTLHVNTIGTLNVLEGIIELDLDARFVYASSAAVYGETYCASTTEEHPTNPISPYGVSKLAGEKLAFAYHRERGLDTTAIRIFNTHGPRQPRYVIFELLKKLRSDQTRLEVLGNPDVIRDYCYVSDMVSGILLTGEKGVSGGVYNASGEHPVAIGDLVNLILLELGLPKETKVHYTGRSWRGDITRMVADISKIKVLGFLPTIGLRVGLRTMITSDWWRRLQE